MQHQSLRLTKRVTYDKKQAVVELKTYLNFTIFLLVPSSTAKL